MEEKKEGCQNPEQLKGDPKDCSLKQIKLCHCDEEKHICDCEKKEE